VSTRNVRDNLSPQDSPAGIASVDQNQPRNDKTKPNQLGTYAI